MKIALINGSPKIKDSASNYILQEVKVLLKDDINIISEYHFKEAQLNTKELEQIIESDILVFVFPLYVDGIPSHLISCLIELEKYYSNINGKNIMVYSIVNCGFYEGIQNKLAVEMIENWCIKSGLIWGQGIGLGAGGMLLSLKGVPIGHGPKRNLGKVLGQFSNNILHRISEKNIFTTANFPRFAYKFAAEMGWRRDIKANGLKTKDLFLKR